MGRALRVLGVAVLAAMQAAAPATAETLAGLRGAKVWLDADAGAKLRVDLQPLYGWNEPVWLYGPDGRRAAGIEIARDHKATTEVALAPGLNLLHLKRSYVATLNIEGARAQIEPLPFETSVRAPRGGEAVFLVPPGTRDFDFVLDNRIGLRGAAVRAVLSAPDGTRHEIAKAGFERDTLAAHFGAASQTGQPLSAAEAADVPQLVPARLHFGSPPAGVWRVALTGEDAAFWLEGIANRFARDAGSLVPPVAAPSPSVRVEIGAETIMPPVIGAASHLGPPGNEYEAKVLAYGTRGDEIYLHQWEGGFPHMERLAARGGVRSLVILREPDAKARALGPREGMAQAARWVAEVLRTAGRPWDEITLQMLNEPNLEMSLARYLDGLGGFIDGLRASGLPMRELDLAAPALGSGDSAEIVDWPWIAATLDRYGADIRTVIWNLYRVRDPLDADLYAKAVAQTAELIRRHGDRGQRIAIGGTNRLGGFADDAVFDGVEAGVWWSAVLSQVANTGRVSRMDYFTVLDGGRLRAKGLFDRNWQPKPQALAQRAIAQVFAGGDVRRVAADHPLLGGVASRGQGLRLALVNTGWLPLAVRVEGAGERLRLHRVVGEGPEQMTGESFVMPPQSVYAGGE